MFSRIQNKGFGPKLLLTKIAFNQGDQIRLWKNRPKRMQSAPLLVQIIHYVCNLYRGKKKSENLGYFLPSAFKNCPE
jgi:hypothetical protein